MSQPFSSSASPAASDALRPMEGDRAEVETLVPRSRIGEIESIRGMAALLIVLFHAPGWNTGKEYISFIQNGYLMVDLFFVLSGFVIYTSYGLHLNDGPAVARFQFLRWGRLYPVHLFFLLFFLVTIATPWEDMKVAFIQQVFLVQAMGPTGNAMSFNYPAWSIGVEFYTYLLFALIAWGAAKVGGQQKKILALVIYSAISLLAWCSIFADELYGFRDLLRCFAGFFIGCMTAALTDKVKWRWPTWIAPASFVAIGLFLEFKHNQSYDPFILILTALLILALVFSSTGWFKKLLLTRPLLWLGEISYSLYMAQLACIYLCEEVLRRLYYRFAHFGQMEEALGIQLAYPVTFTDGLIKYGFFIVVLLVVSSLSYYLLERPCREASRRWTHRPQLVAP